MMYLSSFFWTSQNIYQEFSLQRALSPITSVRERAQANPQTSLPFFFFKLSAPAKQHGSAYASLTDMFKDSKC